MLTEPQDKIIDKDRSISLQEYIKKTEVNIWHKMPTKIKENWESQLNEMRNYIPKIGVFGKTGAGKSSLCNALFGQNVCEISNFGCTKEPKEITLSIGTGGLKLIDVPGFGESIEDDKKYHALYKNLLLEIDLVLWVINADERSHPLNEPFEKTIHHYIDAGKPFLAIVNHVDIINPYREWNVEEIQPGINQTINIEAKRIRISELFKIPINKVIAISAYEQ